MKNVTKEVNYMIDVCMAQGYDPINTVLGLLILCLVAEANLANLTTEQFDKRLEEIYDCIDRSAVHLRAQLHTPTSNEIH